MNKQDYDELGKTPEMEDKHGAIIPPQKQTGEMITPEQHKFAVKCQEIDDEIDNSTYEAVELAFLRGHGAILNTAEDEDEPWDVEVDVVADFDADADFNANNVKWNKATGKNRATYVNGKLAQFANSEEYNRVHFDYKKGKADIYFNAEKIYTVEQGQDFHIEGFVRGKLHLVLDDTNTAHTKPEDEMPRCICTFRVEGEMVTPNPDCPVHGGLHGKNPYTAHTEPKDEVKELEKSYIQYVKELETEVGRLKAELKALTTHTEQEGENLTPEQRVKKICAEYGKLIAETTSFHPSVIQMLVISLDSILTANASEVEITDCDTNPAEDKQPPLRGASRTERVRWEDDITAHTAEDEWDADALYNEIIHDMPKAGAKTFLEKEQEDNITPYNDQFIAE